MSHTHPSCTLPKEIRNRHGERLDFTLHLAVPGKDAFVIVGHGVTGNKDRPHLIALAEGLAEAGINALRISFSGNGDSEGRFADSCISKELEDLGAVIDALPGWKLGYVGHSMGGAVGVLRASRDPRLSFLISLAGMTHTAAFAAREFGTLHPGTDCMWDNPDCPLSAEFMTDMARIGDVLAAGRAVQVPWLLLHGTTDDVVPVQDSDDIKAVAGANTTLIKLPEGDHAFSGVHSGSMVSAVVTWIKRLAR